MGAVDLVIQIESPPSVASALQRVGRAGHQVGEVSRGVLFPKHRGDLAQTAVAVERMRSGRDRVAARARQPARRARPADRGRDRARRLGGRRPLRRSCAAARRSPRCPAARTTRRSTCSAAATRPTSSPSCGRASSGTGSTGDLTGRPGAQRLAVTSGGTIPDRGLFGVFLVGGDGPGPPGRRARRGDGLRVAGRRRVRARRHQLADRGHHPRPGAGHPGARRPRPAAVLEGRRASAARPSSARRSARSPASSAALPATQARERARAGGLDDWAADNLVAYLDRAARGHRRAAQRPHHWSSSGSATSSATGGWSCTPRTAPRCTPRGRWRSTPGCASGTASTARRSPPTTASCIRIPDTDAEPPGGELVVFDPDEIERARHHGGRRLGAVRLPVPRVRGPGAAAAPPRPRAPLARCGSSGSAAAQLLEVAAQYPSFPIVLEAVRECLQDVYDLPALIGADAAHRAPRGHGRRRRHRRSPRRSPGPCCSATSPSSSTRATPRSPSAGPPRCRSTRACSPSCSAGPSCASCSTPTVLAEVEAELQRLAPDRRARDAEGVADLLRLLGPLTADEVPARCVPERPTVAGWLAALADAAARRAGPDRRRGPLGAVEDVGRLRDGLGRAGPAGHARRLHRAGRRPARRPGRPLRPHPRPVHHRRGRRPARARRGRGPAHPAAARRPGPGARGRVPARRLAARSGATPRCCAGCGAARWPGCARRSSRSTPRRWAGSCPPGSRSPVAGRRRCAASTACSRSSSSWPAARCPPPRWSRWCCRPGSRDYEPAFLDELTAAGEVVWAGHGALPGTDGWVSLHLADQAPLTLPDPASRSSTPSCTRRCSTRSLRAAPGSSASSPTRSAPPTTARCPAALWDLVWAGRVSNDTLAPLRALTRAGTHRHRTRRRPTAGPRRRRVRPGLPARGRPARDRRPLGAAARARHRPDPARPRDRRAAARPARRGHPRRGGQRAGARRVRRRSTRCSRRSRSPAAAGAATSSTASAPPSSAPPARSTGCAPSPSRRDAAARSRVALAATDPANPYGAALPWPEAPATTARPPGHRPGRKAGALVVLVDGALVALRRARRPHPAHLDRRRGHAHAAAAVVARRGGPPRRARPADRRAGRRRAAARRPAPTPLRQALQAAGFVADPAGTAVRGSVRA